MPNLSKSALLLALSCPEEPRPQEQTDPRPDFASAQPLPDAALRGRRYGELDAGRIRHQ